ncbi:hypothetical protein BWI17_08195 [Betaproteobacteria bacterium GR16-43]|nr:hypothetical protein BWI17_08195 [Betaproteobacteria bacterium GR16-43]
MKVVYVCFAALEPGPQGLTSRLASVRYRAILPARGLTRLGHEVRLVVAGSGAWSDAEADALRCDVLVIGKSVDPSTEELARKLRERGARIVLDVCDFQFGHPAHGAHFERLLARADDVIAASEAMADAIRRYAGREATVISDPVEGVLAEPAFAPRPPFLKVLWFGNAQSAQSLAERASELHELGAAMPVRLTVMTAPLPEIAALVARIDRDGAGRSGATFVEWSQVAMAAALAGHDAVWLTSRDGERERVKSPNRLVEAIWAGRLAISDPVPSYEAFAAGARIGAGLARGMLESVADIPGTVERIRAGQEQVRREHSPERIAALWAAALTR